MRAGSTPPGKAPRSVRTRLMAVVLGALVACTALFIAVVLGQQAAARAEYAQAALRLTEAGALEYERLLDAADNLLSVLAQLPLVQGPVGGCNALLARLREARPGLASLTVADLQGHVVCNAPVAPAGLTVADRPYFQQALRTGQLAVSTLETGRTTQQSVVHLARPLRGPDGTAQGVVAAGLELRWLEQFAAPLHLPRGSSLMVFDARGRVLSAYPASSRAGGHARVPRALLERGPQQHEGAVWDTDDAGRPELHSFAPLRSAAGEAPLYLSITVPSGSALGEGRALLLRDLAVLWLIGASALGVVWWRTRTLVLEPVQALARAASRQRAGDLEARSGLSYRSDELGQLARGFDEMVLQLQAAIRAREELLEVASHEMKTPLAAMLLQIQSALARLRSGQGRMDVDTLRSKLEFTESQVRRLSELVQEMVEAHQFVLRPGSLPADDGEVLDLSALVTSVAARFEATLSRTGTPLSLELAPEVVGRWDRALMERVVTHLLANAIKFGRGRPVTVALEAKADVARLTVRDQGIGISREDQARIFQRFERAVPVQHYGGLGLGLWVVQRIVHHYGGDISVQSEPGHGSTFTVTLPRAPAAARERPAAHPSGEAPAPPAP